MARIMIKPLSLNHAYRGRRFETPELKQYKRDIALQLPKIVVPEGLISVSYTFGVSNKGSDADNLIKAFQDCLAECYGFNDNQIYEWYVKKVIVKKGEEFVDFTLSTVS